VTDRWTTYESPLGRLTVILTPNGALRAIRFPGAPAPPEAPAQGPHVRAQLDEYFAGERTEFELEVELEGTGFQMAVWGRLRRIPYGATAGYGEIAEDLGESVFPAGLEPHERARAVGTEVGRTPVPIVIPCHRVIGADGSLIGFGGGLDRKRRLLDLEAGVGALLTPDT
jgi:methylated-DNA-[protein]-cysteine S-methyltransferase